MQNDLLNDESLLVFVKVRKLSVSFWNIWTRKILRRKCDLKKIIIKTQGDVSYVYRFYNDPIRSKWEACKHFYNFRTRVRTLIKKMHLVSCLINIKFIKARQVNEIKCYKDAIKAVKDLLERALVSTTRRNHDLSL